MTEYDRLEKIVRETVMTGLQEFQKLRIIEDMDLDKAYITAQTIALKKFIDIYTDNYFGKLN